MSGFSFSNPVMRLAWLSGPHSFTHHWSHLISVTASARPAKARPNAIRNTTLATRGIMRRRISVLPFVPRSIRDWSRVLPGPPGRLPPIREGPELRSNLRFGEAGHLGVELVGEGRLQVGLGGKLQTELGVTDAERRVRGPGARPPARDGPPARGA